MDQLRRTMNILITVCALGLSGYAALVMVPSTAAAGPCVAGPHNGSITTDQSWCVADNPHRVTGDVTVVAGVTLTIEPGALVEIDGQGTAIVVNGTMEAMGTSANRIRFTTDNVSPAPGQWEKLVFNPSSSGNMLDYVAIEYGGFFSPVLDVRTGAFLIRNSIIRNNDNVGIAVNDASPTINTTTFTDNADRAIELNGASFPALSGLSASGNGFNGVAITGTTITSDYAWGAGIANYLVTSDVTVDTSATLMIEPGTTVRLTGAETEIIVDGALEAQGSAVAPILFTSGQATPAPGQWKKLVFNAGSSGHVLDYVTVEYGGYFSPVVDIRTDGLTMSNSTIRNNDNVGMVVNDASPMINTTTFTDNADRAIELNGASFPALSGLSASGNGFNGVAITGTTITSDYAWGAGIANYLVTDDVTVNPDTTLTVVPGTTVRFIGADTQIIVDGTLTAEGTADDGIRFTSGQAIPAPGQWKQLVFNPTSRNSVLTYVTVEYGGYFAPAVEIATSSVRISNSTIARNNDDGMRVSAGTPTIINNNIVENADFGLRNTSRGTVRATCNWWGAVSGPTNAANAGGVGQEVSNNVTFDPWLIAAAPGGTCSGGRGGGGGLVIYLPLMLR